MSTVSMARLRPEQGPPLSVPLGFFVAGPFMVAMVGLMLLATGGRDGGSPFSGFNLALVHLTTTGFLMTIMVGALYQMLPVVAGAVLPMPRLGHAVNGLLAAGAAVLATALAADRHELFLVAFGLFTGALVAFGVPAAIAVLRTPAKVTTAWGLRLALVGLVLVASLGLRMAWARGTTGYTDPWIFWRHAHAHLGLLGWIGALVASVSWQVVPMFFLAPEVEPLAQRSILVGCALSMIGLLATFFFDLEELPLYVAVAPGAIAVWIIHPITTLRSLRKRKRKRRDPSLWFWFLALALAPVVLALDVAAALSDVPTLGPLFVLFALWGWSGALVHGMLTRIVPFLVWLHRCSPWVGLRPNVPSARELYPDRWSSVGFGLHVATLVLGTAAILLDEALLWRAFGALLAATMGLVVVRVLLAVEKAPKDAPPATLAADPSLASPGGNSR